MLATALNVLGTPVHRTLFPFAWVTTLHAARISLVFNAARRATQSNLSLGANLIGFLLMCWGGSIGTHLLLSLPPPQLYALAPWVNYSAVHLLVSTIFNYVSIPDQALTNAVLFPLDGLLRAFSVLHALFLLNNNPAINPLLATSPLFHFILGATASAGGGLLGTTLSVWTPNWQLSTPPPLRTGVWGLWGTLDIWAGGVVAITYGILTGHPAYVPLNVETTVPTARTLSAALMVALFGLRVLASSRPAPARPKETEKEKTE